MKAWRRLSALLLAAVLLSGLVPAAEAKALEEPAAPAAEEQPEARDISTRVRMKAGRPLNKTPLVDGVNRTRVTLTAGTKLACTAREPVMGLYFETEAPAGRITVTVGDRVIEADEQNYLHFYLDGIDAAEFTILFQDKVSVANLHFLSEGSIPDWVQFWEPTPTECDLLLLPTHYDDESLYFGGVIPWALDRGAVVNVAYYCDHRTEPWRKHEMLNALWASGLRTYPIFGSFFDSWLVDLNTALRQLAVAGYGWEDIQERQVEIFRKYKPQVILTHSETGEYGHCQHILYERLCLETAMMAADETIFPELAEQYGAHSISKIYIHNFRSEAGQIFLDLDQPLDSFDDRTPYEITIDAFRKHKSQADAFIGWLKDPGAARNIADYSPCEWGLYYSRVGSDSRTDTIFENIRFLNGN